MLSLGSIIREHLPFFIFAFGAFGATIFILSGIYIRNSMKNKIRRCTSSVIANAYDVFSSGEGLGDQRVRFKYTVNGVEYTSLHPVILNLSKIQLEKGQDVELFYNPSKPSEYVFRELDEWHAESSLKIAIIGGVFSFMLTTFVAIIDGIVK